MTRLHGKRIVGRHVIEDLVPDRLRHIPSHLDLFRFLGGHLTPLRELLLFFCRSTHTCIPQSLLLDE